MSAPLPFELTPHDVLRRRENGEDFHVLDVREAAEHQICRLDGAALIPMSMIPGSLPELDSQAEEKPLLVYCHHGVRSLHVVNWLRHQGVEACFSLAGGIDRWSREIDPAIPRY